MKPNKQTPVLNDRARQLLKALIDCYIREGQPVGSKKLSETSGLNISTATIRNVMASLDHMGLISSPHTSAGRIPTEQGFRMFVDSMLEMSPLDKNLQIKLQQYLNPDQNKDRLIESASSLLSDITHMAGIISIPKGGHLSLRQIEFLSLPDNRILAILVINEKEVQNRVIHVEREYSQDELTRISNYLNQHFTGHDIFEIRGRMLKELQKARNQVDDFMKAAIDIADQALKPEQVDQPHYVVQGQANLIRFNPVEDTKKLQQIFEVFERKRDILNLLDRCIKAEDIQVFIGREAGVDVFDECSIITAPYGVEGEILGVLGVIGPTRMQYGKVISIVDVTARLLGSALNPKK